MNDELTTVDEGTEEVGRFYDIAMFPLQPGGVVRHEVPEDADLWQVVTAQVEKETEHGTIVIQQPFAVFVIRQMTEDEEIKKAAYDGFFSNFGRPSGGRGGAGGVEGADLPV